MRGIRRVVYGLIADLPDVAKVAAAGYAGVQRRGIEQGTGPAGPKIVDTFPRRTAERSYAGKQERSSARAGSIVYTWRIDQGKRPVGQSAEVDTIGGGQLAGERRVHDRNPPDPSYAPLCVACMAVFQHAECRVYGALSLDSMADCPGHGYVHLYMVQETRTKAKGWMPFTSRNLTSAIAGIWGSYDFLQ